MFNSDDWSVLLPIHYSYSLEQCWYKECSLKCPKCIVPKRKDPCKKLVKWTDRYSIHFYPNRFQCFREDMLFCKICCNHNLSKMMSNNNNDLNLAPINDWYHFHTWNVLFALLLFSTKLWCSVYYSRIVIQHTQIFVEDFHYFLQLHPIQSYNNISTTRVILFEWQRFILIYMNTPQNDLNNVCK